jgi:hypothetical protein
MAWVAIASISGILTIRAGVRRIQIILTVTCVGENLLLLERKRIHKILIMLGAFVVLGNGGHKSLVPDVGQFVFDIAKCRKLSVQRNQTLVD